MFGAEWCVHLRASCRHRLQRGFKDCWDDAEGPAQQLLVLRRDVRIWLKSGRPPSPCSDGRLMVLAAAARVRMSLDRLGHGMKQNEPGMLARNACPNWPYPSD